MSVTAHTDESLEAFEDEADRRIDDLVAANPMRLYSPQEVRQILFGQDVADDVRPTEYWIRAQVRAKRLECTRFGSSVWFDGPQIKRLRRQHMRGKYGVLKYPDKPARRR